MTQSVCVCVCVDVSAAIRGRSGVTEAPAEGAESLCQGAATGAPETTAGPDRVLGELLQGPGTTQTHQVTHQRLKLLVIFLHV